MGMGWRLAVLQYTLVSVLFYFYFFLYLVSVWLVHLSVWVRSHMYRQGAGGRPLCHSPSVCLIIKTGCLTECKAACFGRLPAERPTHLPPQWWYYTQACWKPVICMWMLKTAAWFLTLCRASTVGDHSSPGSKESRGVFSVPLGYT